MLYEHESDSAQIDRELLGLRIALERCKRERAGQRHLVASQIGRDAIQLAQRIWGPQDRLFEFWEQRLQRCGKKMMVYELGDLLRDLDRSHERRERIRIDTAEIKVRVDRESPRRR